MGTRLLAIFTALAITATGRPALAAESGANPIPPGTKITQANWQQYQQYMTDGMKMLFRGDHFWRFPENGEIDIAAQQPIPLPSFFNAATEKNAGTAKLTQMPDAGWIATGYQGGLPFPDPLKGDPAMAGERVFWDEWYRYHPRVEQAPNCSYILDQFGNMTRTADTNLVYSQLTHVSDPGFPPTDPNAGPYYYVFYGQQTAPEGGKYFTTLSLLMDDPTREPELYSFIPTLRRSLRLSQSARCAPIFGTDYVYDDSFEGPPGLPQLFDIKLLGVRKIITLAHAAYDSFNSCGSADNVDPRYFYQGSKSFAPFPNPGSGAWEVREVYAISLRRLPQYAPGYCYSNRVIYVDKQNFFPDQLELYDNAGNLYKWSAVLMRPYQVPNAKPGDLAISIAGQNTGFMINFEDKHTTVFIGLHGCVDSDCESGGYLDATRWALPEGLSRIMQ